jgi:diacylglycerol kinase
MIYSLLKKKAQGFGHAFRGLGLMLRDYNAKFHLPAGLAVGALALWLRLPLSECLWLLWCVALMWVAETFNSAIERTVDLASGGQWHPLAKQAKDLSAAAVLLSLLFAAAVGAVLLLPPLAERFGLWQNHLPG